MGADTPASPRAAGHSPAPSPRDRRAVRAPAPSPARAPAAPPARAPAAAPAPAAAAPAAPPAAPPPPKSFLQWLASLFAGDDPEKQKQRELKEIAGYLRKSRPRWYNPAQRLAEPALARFFWEIYRAVSGAQLLVQGAASSAALRSAVVETGLGPREKALRERLTEASIEERARKGSEPGALAAEVSRDLRALRERLEPPVVKEMDGLYNRLLVLLDLVGFDYFYLLRRFDASLPERDFTYKPRFEPVNGEHVLEEVEDFLEILPCVDPDADWDRALAVLKEHRGVEVIPRDAMRRALHLLRDAQRTGILLMIARHLEGEPAWKPMARAHRERVVAPWMEKLRAESELTARKVAQSRQTEKVASLVTDVFGTASLVRLANYSEQANAAFTQKMLGGFTRVAPLNQLRAFLADFLDRNVREVVDVLLIKGKWVNKDPSQQMSEAFHQLLKISEAITAFDADLGEDGDTGRRLRTIAIRVERDRSALADMRATLQKINDEAQSLLASALGQFVSLAKALKLAHDDCVSPSPQLVANWRELRASEKDVRGMIAGVYRKIYSFVQLLQAAGR